MQNKIFTKIYGWMFLGLLISFITGYYVSTNENMLYNIFQTGTYWILAIIEIVVVIWLSAGIRKMNIVTARTLYILYSILTGLTLSSIFLAYKIGSIIYVFGFTSIMFAIMAILGKTTKLDLTKLGTILFVGLLGIVIASIINIFVGSQTFDLVLCIIGIIIFTAYIAYDVNKIKYTLEYLEEDKVAIIGAFELYLDFINLFIKLLRLFGKRDD
ncbi:MAG: Bax inhibitor-1/YccA family protein [Bacilli bacterium]|nr:Bax inhibitor-1/YccA family protein [Bacilli bacterium]